jgi:hypothetical protein
MDIIDINKLKQLCNEFTVEVSFNGFAPIAHKVIDANKLLERIHEISYLPKSTFMLNINKGDFMCSELSDIFHNIKSQGTFKLAGHEDLSNHSYIECSKLNWLNN